MMPDSGWLTSCAIDAVKAPRLKLRSELAECVLREPAVRHVLDRTDVLELAILVSGAMGDQVQMLDRTVRHLQPVLVVQVAARSPRAVDHIVQQRHVFRMNARGHQLERHGYAWLELESAVRLI
jgi:hypothetical protein